MGSDDLLENLPLVLMAVAFILIAIYAARHHMGVSSVFRRVRRMGDLRGTERTYPGLNGTLNGRRFHLYYEEVESKLGQPMFLLSWYLSRNIDVNLVFSLGLKEDSSYGFDLPQEQFNFKYLPKDLQDGNIGHLMHKIAGSKDFFHFAKISVERDAVKYYHHITGMSTEYMQDVLGLLFSLAGSVEKAGPVFRIKGFEH